MPRTLAQNAQYIAETIKPAIKSAIEAQGVTVPSTDSFLDYADRIGEIEGGGSGYQLKDLPTGSIATVNDAAELPLNALKVSVEAWQEGSGDPSPSNIRPIHGWDSGEISVVGKNWVKQVIIGYVDKQNNVIKVDNDSETVLFFAKKGIKYIVSSQSTFDRNIIAQVNDDNITHQKPVYNIIDNSGYTWEATWTGWTVWYVKVSRNTVIEQTAQVEIGNQATTYEPYQGKQYTLNFPTTIYGAEWDVVSGELKQTDGYIASYNGETLPSTWISDRDVYASGTTPTIGAEVVYKLATPQTIDLSPLSIRMLEGVNNVYADCGEILEGEYFIGEGGNEVISIDYTTVLYSGTSTSFTTATPVTYTATQPCVAYCEWYGTSQTNMCPVLNGDNLTDMYALSNDKKSHIFFLQAGDTLAQRTSTDGLSCYFHMAVYGYQR